MDKDANYVTRADIRAPLPQGPNADIGPRFQKVVCHQDNRHLGQDRPARRLCARCVAGLSKGRGLSLFQGGFAVYDRAFEASPTDAIRITLRD